MLFLNAMPLGEGSASLMDFSVQIYDATIELKEICGHLQAPVAHILHWFLIAVDLVN